MKDTAYYLGLKYRKVVSQDEEGIYTIEVPDLPGCVSDGDTIGEAFAELNDAMEAWITSRLEAGLSVPEPRSSNEYSGKFLVRVPRSLHQRLAEQAEADGVSLNQYVVGLLSERSVERSAVRTLQSASFLERSRERQIAERLEELARELSEKKR